MVRGGSQVAPPASPESKWASVTLPRASPLPLPTSPLPAASAGTSGGEAGDGEAGGKAGGGMLGGMGAEPCAAAPPYENC
jgi:hypothetical protein